MQVDFLSLIAFKESARLKGCKQAHQYLRRHSEQGEVEFLTNAPSLAKKRLPSLSATNRTSETSPS